MTNGQILTIIARPQGSDSFSVCEETCKNANAREIQGVFTMRYSGVSCGNYASYWKQNIGGYYNGRLNGVKDIRPRLSAGIIGTTQATLWAAVPGNYDAVATCRSKCSANDAFCLNIPVKKSLQTQLRQFVQALAAKPSTLSMKEVRRYFAVKSDPCNRQDVNFSGGEFWNAGSSCHLTNRFKEADLTAQIAIPPTLAGQLAVENAQGLVSVSFDDPDLAPRLALSNAAYNADWGGAIDTVFGDANSVGFSINKKSCVMLDLR